MVSPFIAIVDRYSNKTKSTYDASISFNICFIVDLLLKILTENGL
jgi:hypothetical protein